MRRRVPLAVTAVVAVSLLFRVDPLIDVVTGLAPDGASLKFSFPHVLIAPLSLLADWLNGGSRADLVGFLAWAMVVYALARWFARINTPRVTPWRETVYGAAFVLGLLAFVAWVVFVPRSIPRLAARSQDQIVFDVHSHTSSSRDGRAGFGVAATARWHQRAGFHAAYLTDHNVMSDWEQWSRERTENAVRLLPGEELSLRGLHVIVLGNTQRINNEPWNDDWDSTLALLRTIDTSSYLIASLPEYWKHHWGSDIGRIVEAGVDGFEVWTTSPKAMEVPDSVRREVVERGRLERLAVFGATDMHGIGYTASVWNVATLPGWRAMPDLALARTLIGRLRRDPGAHRVLAMRRFLPDGRAGRLFAVPLGLLHALRAASLLHITALLLWIWLPWLAASRRGLRSR